MSELRRHANVPAALLSIMAESLRDAYDRGWIDSIRWASIDRTLTDITDVQGGCERIKSTPIPFSFNILLHRIVAVYCVSLPIGIIDQVDVDADH